MRTEYPAHIRQGAAGPEVQTVLEHCRNTAGFAAELLAEVPLRESAYLAGFLHDCGKMTGAFKDYIEKGFQGLPVVRGSVNHTFFAVRFLMERYGQTEKYGPNGPLTAEILAYSVGSHHGLFDGVNERHESGLLHRMTKPDIGYEEALEAMLSQCTSLEKLDRLFGLAVQEVDGVLEKLMPLLDTPGVKGGEAHFYLSMLVRLLASAVIAGDRQDTQEFQEGARYPAQPSPEQREKLWKELLERVEEKILSLPADTPINRARRKISDQCRYMADRPGGVYRLNVPTGGGKTLASLRYALAHAAAFQKKRIVFVSPLLSILEQNAKVVRDYIGDDNLILEHHSNVVYADQTKEELDEAELLMEVWSSPVIITTLLQLLNTLFSGKTGCIRRFVSLCNSIIVIDEVQTVPTHLLSLFHLAVGFLAAVCDTTVILCSATQPFDQASERPIGVPVGDLVPYDDGLWKVFRRTEIRQEPGREEDDFAPLIREILEDTDSLLIVCNKKDEAQNIFTQAEDISCKRFYLSAAMCVAHRKETLDKLKETMAAKDGEKVLCVSTQVIEAGVDISFGRVIRLTAGMDSIVQAAGRCNRNGESEMPAQVTVVNCLEETLNHLPDIERGKNASIALFEDFRTEPEKYGHDLTSDEAISEYYRILYKDMQETAGNLQDGPVKIGGVPDTLYRLLSDNEGFASKDFLPEAYSILLNQAFKTAGEAFHVFDGDTEDVLVPYGQGEELILELLNLHLPEDLEEMGAILRKARPYTVAIYPWLKDALDKQGAVVPICGGKILTLRKDFYNETMGLVQKPGQQEFLGV